MFIIVIKRGYELVENRNHSRFRWFSQRCVRQSVSNGLMGRLGNPPGIPAGKIVFIIFLQICFNHWPLRFFKTIKIFRAKQNAWVATVLLLKQWQAAWRKMPTVRKPQEKFAPSDSPWECPCFKSGRLLCSHCGSIFRRRGSLVVARQEKSCCTGALPVQQDFLSEDFLPGLDSYLLTTWSCQSCISLLFCFDWNVFDFFCLQLTLIRCLWRTNRCPPATGTWSRKNGKSSWTTWKNGNGNALFSWRRFSSQQRRKWHRRPPNHHVDRRVWALWAR